VVFRGCVTALCLSDSNQWDGYILKRNQISLDKQYYINIINQPKNKKGGIMKNARAFLLIVFLSLTFSSTDARPQIYYGYWDYYKFCNSVHSYYVPTNSGLLKPNQFYQFVQNHPDRENLLLEITYEFNGDVNQNGRPDIEDLETWSLIFDDIKDLTHYDSYKKRCLGIFVAAEPIGLGSSNAKAWMNRRKDQFDIDMTKFVVSGNFTGTPHSDLAMFYDYPSIQTNCIFIKESDGIKLTSGYETWLDRTYQQHYFGNYRFVVSGNFNGGNWDDIIVGYDYPTIETNKMFMFPSDGSRFGNGECSYEIWFNRTYDQHYFGNYKFVVSGDYNGDGLDDLAVGYDYPTIERNKMFIFLSNGSGFGDGGCTYEIWFDRAYDEHYFGNYKFVVSGDYNGDGLDDLAVGYDYPTIERNKMFIFLSNGSGFGDGECTYEIWFDRAYDEHYFGYYKYVVTGDFNGDEKDDLGIGYDYPNGWQRVLRYLSNPSQQKFDYAGNWACDWWHTEDGYDFDKIDFALCDNFVDDDLESDFNAYSDSCDDIVYFYDNGDNPESRQYIYGFISRYGIGWSNKARLEALTNAAKDEFGDDKIYSILYMKPSTGIPDLFPENLNWISTDPYPFTTNRPINHQSGYDYIKQAITNIANQKPGAHICLVGQSAMGQNLRWPTTTEEYWYYELIWDHGAQAQVKALLWWIYKDWGDFYGSESNEDLLNIQKDIGYNLMEFSPPPRHGEEKDDYNQTAKGRDHLSIKVHNPLSTSRTEIEFSYEEKFENINLNIFDVSGRLIRSFGENEIKTKKSINWDGTDEQGKQVSSGIYIIKLESPKEFVARKIVILR
jgi:hypothetical protein